EILERAKTFLMLPDYLNFLLTGTKANEYTNATSTQLVNAFSKQWDKELMELLGIDSDMFQKILPPKSELVSLRNEIVEEFVFDLKVLLPEPHETGSAVGAVPDSEDAIYICSCTWQLIGVENTFTITINKAQNYNFTNEGGLDYRFRFLKNLIGLWM